MDLREERRKNEKRKGKETKRRGKEAETVWAASGSDLLSIFKGEKTREGVDR